MAFAALSAAPAFAQDDSTDVEALVITGSRIPVRDAVSNSPVVTVGSEQLEEIGTGTIETYLNSLPQLSPSVTKTNNNPTGGGSAFLDLRQLGTARGLVLVDGKRVVPGASNGAVDVSILPPGLIDRVEIITGGASAVYGSDAISGVVNFILKKEFEGLEATAQYGWSGYGDGGEFNGNIIGGGSFADDRGNIIFSIGYTSREEIGQAERPFSQFAEYCDLSGCALNPSPTTGDGTFTLSAALAAQPAFIAYMTGQGLPAGELYSGNRIGFNPGGTPFIAGVGGGVYGYTGPNTSGWDPSSFFGYNFNPTNLIQSGFQRYNFYTALTFDLTENIEFYTNALYSGYTAQNALAPAPSSGTVNVLTSPGLPAAFRTALTASGITTLSVSRRFVELGPRIYSFDTQAFQLQGGFRGDFDGIVDGTTWNYDAFASFGRFQQQIRYDGFPQTTRLAAALNGCPVGASPAGPVGSSGTTTACTPINILGAGSITTAAREYITAKGQIEDVQIDQNLAQITLAGDLFNIWAGPVGFAIGAEYRNLDFEDMPPESVQTSTLGGGNQSGPTVGGYDVYEYFGEVRVPILADLPLIKYLGFEGGYRFSDYSTGVSTETYKYGGEYSPVDWLRFRGLVQHAIRSPGIGELYSTVQQGFPSVTSGNLDPCDKDSTARTGPDGAAVLALCQAQASVITATYDTFGSQYRTLAGGNPNLEPEVSDSYSIGMVFRPTSNWPAWTQSFIATADYWSIEIENVVSSVGFSTSLARCYNATYNPTFSAANTYCQNIHRDPATGYLTSTTEPGYISQQNANLAAYKASGLDFTFAYKVVLSDYGMSDSLGSIGLSLTGTWYENQQSQNLPGEPFSDSYVGYVFDGTPGSTTLPEWKLSGRAAWNFGDYALSLRWLHIDAVQDAFAVAGDIPGISDFDYFYLNGAWQFNDTVEFFGGIDNLLDTQPPKYSSGFQYGTDPSTYDVIGRFFYAGIKARF